MNERSRGQFKKLIGKLCLTFDKEISVELIDAYWDVLEHYPIAELDIAVTRWLAEGDRFPVPAKLIAKMPNGRVNTHLSPNEAWAVVLKSFDEAETLVLTAEMLEARGFALACWEAGDKIAARMSFLAAYERLIAGAGPPVWKLTLGHDRQRRDEAIAQFVAAGFLPQSDLAKYRIADNRTPGVSFAQLAHLAAEKTGQDVPVDGLKAKWGNLKTLLDGPEPAGEAEARHRAEVESARQRQSDLVAQAESRLGDALPESLWVDREQLAKRGLVTEER